MAGLANSALRTGAPDEDRVAQKPAGRHVNISGKWVSKFPSLQRNWTGRSINTGRRGSVHLVTSDRSKQVGNDR